MNTFSNKIFTQFEIRKNRKQKNEFINEITNKLNELHYPYEIQQTKGWIPSKNIIVGDLKQAKLICTAHYDTCATMGFLPNFITPLNIGVFLLYQVVLAIFLIGMAILAGYVLMYLSQGWIPYLSGYMITLILILIQIYFGYRNPKNYNDNTSGVMVLLEVLFDLPEELRHKVAFVFFDNEEKGLLGSSAFAKKYGKELKEKILVNYDCVSDGDTIFMKYNKKMDENAYKTMFEKAHVCHNGKQLFVTNKGFYPSDQKSCERYCATVAVAALKRSKLVGLYMDRIHTPKDTIFDENNIDLLKEGIVSFVKEL